MSVIQEALEILGVACLVLAPVLWIATFFLLSRLGAAISRADPALWEEMKPGLYSDIRVSRAHRLRLKEFITSGEYARLNEPLISRLAVLYQRANIAGVIALCGGIGVVIWSFH